MTTTTFPSTAAPAKPARRRVVDAPTRVFHWLFALSFVGAYLTADGERWRLLHVTLGYTLAGLLAFRVLYGLFGPRPAGPGPALAQARGRAGLAEFAHLGAERGCRQLAPGPEPADGAGRVRAAGDGGAAYVERLRQLQRLG